MNPDAPFVIFLHIPKACGTTLTKLFTRWCAPREIFNASHQPHDEACATLRQLSSQRPPGVRVILGHAPFGLHEALDGPARYVTVLRDPIERIVSHFHYASRTPQHSLHAEIKRGQIGLLDLARRSADLQTRYLGGRIGEKPDAATLALAKERLVENFAVAGITERFDETVVLIHRAFGRKLRPFASENVRPQRSAADSLNADELRELRATHELDAELYDFVRRRFEEQITQEDAGFERGVAALRRGNRLANFATRLLRRVRPTA
jgi:hypothetical protein